MATPPSPPVSGVSTYLGSDVVHAKGTFGSLVVHTNSPSPTGTTRCVFASDSAGNPISVATISDGDASTYAPATALGSVTGHAPVPPGTLQSAAAVGNHPSGGAAVTVVFPAVIHDARITIQHWQ